MVDVQLSLLEGSLYIFGGVICGETNNPTSFLLGLDQCTVLTKT